MYLFRPGAFVRGLYKGFAGYYSRDRYHHYTQAQISAADEAAQALKDCVPIENHFSDEDIFAIQKAVAVDDIEAAQDIVQNAEFLKGKHWCYDAFRYALALYNTCSPDSLRHATYSFIYERFI